MLQKQFKNPYCYEKITNIRNIQRVIHESYFDKKLLARKKREIAKNIDNTLDFSEYRVEEE